MGLVFGMVLSMILLKGIILDERVLSCCTFMCPLTVA